MADSKSKTPKFLVGQAAARQLQRELNKSTNPAETISSFQRTRSLHTMLSKAFGTSPAYTTSKKKTEVESLDTDPVLVFLTHLGVSQYDVHKRIADTLQKQLEDEIRKVTNQEALLHLLKNCWHYATTVPELRPILWGLLKQLGDRTPLTVLKALAEDDGEGKQKHEEIFRPLPPLLKRLVWEADWDHKMPIEKENIDNPSEYSKLVQSTLLFKTVTPLVEEYTSNAHLIESAKLAFATSVHERRILTTQRRALAQSTTTKSSTPSSTAALLRGKGTNAGTTTSISNDNSLSSGKAVSRIRDLLSDSSSGSISYRPKLLHGILSMLMMKHGTDRGVLTDVNLHCTLVADILLSAGGSLPKIYQPLLTLARALDDAVKNGVFSEKDLMKVQGALKLIFAADGDKTSSEEETKKEGKGETDDSSTFKPNTFLKRQLNRIITAGVTAMKESDPQSLFLNPVTDNIAPGYSKVIKKPMSLTTIQEKIDKNVYNSLQDWEVDVKLMFKNCADYNKGPSGKWFRDEAGRQLKVFKQEIFSQAKKLYMVEVQKRTAANDVAKRKPEDESPNVNPLQPMNKKRKLNLEDYSLSIPTLASMLLSDPFVVRLLLDHVLRSLRVDVLSGSSIPAAHKTIPSTLQLLHIAQWSSQFCLVRGKRYLVPDAGLMEPRDSFHEAIIPHYSLRRYLPLVVHLMLEAKLDKRLSPGGDLVSVSQSVPRPPAPVIEPETKAYSQVAVALLQGAFVYTCLPGNSQETSLAVTFSKFSQSLLSLLPKAWDEQSFFACLVPSILRHKSRLKGPVRDAILTSWIEWLSDSKINGEKAKIGSMLSPAHEYLLILLNEWSKFGNTLVSRDILLLHVPQIVETVNATESDPNRKLSSLWKATDTKEDFNRIKQQYERILGLLPDVNDSVWLCNIGGQTEGGSQQPEKTQVLEE
ncbi:unnamed protein product [Cylindrotheca closterium]|uniref:Bromo domain-containing protein n=1 Tax=Cylindrotheca closterium TaxID=2856 RepID=A0AAD2CQY2_9STRA|nr:unnamed protein product [Cylindrotheca closterium]